MSNRDTTSKRAIISSNNYPTTAVIVRECNRRRCKTSWGAPRMAPKHLGTLSTSRLESPRHISSMLALLPLILLLQLINPPVLPIAIKDADCVAPTIDYSHNMRILKLPKSTQVGELIYRLKGSDGDPDSRLQFGVHGIEARSLLDIVPVPGHWNEADVYLRSALLEPQYNLSLFVADATNKTTQVESTILVVDDTEFLQQQLHQSQHLLDAAGADTSYASTNDHPHHEQQSNDTLGWTSTPGQTTASTSSIYSPFIRPTRNVFLVPENTKPGETIGLISVLESQLSELPVKFELRGQGADKFAIRYVFGPRGQSKGELVLGHQPVDYEQQNLFNLKVLALNAWTNVKFDTRNVASMDIVITVGDVQDTAPQFRALPHSLKLSNSMQPDELVCKFEAQDGDLGDQRPIKFALDAGSPLIDYFHLDPSNGELRLAKPISDLMLHSTLGLSNQQQTPFGGGPMFLTVIASEQPDTSSYEHLWPPMISRVEIPIVLVDQFNEPPQFYGGLQTTGDQLASMHRNNIGAASNSRQPMLFGYLIEQPAAGLQPIEQHRAHLASAAHDTQISGPDSLVQWYTNHSLMLSNDQGPNHFGFSHTITELIKQLEGKPLVLDLNQGLNGTFELQLEGPDAHLFQLEPGLPVSRMTTLSLRTRHSFHQQPIFDRDSTTLTEAAGNNNNKQTLNQKLFQLDLVARDFGSPRRLSSRMKCLIELIDSNDNAPQFELDLYTFSVHENAQLGQMIGNIRAHDLDQAGQQRVRYTKLTGLDSQLFHLDPITGLLSLEGGQLDREKLDHYQLVAEARDPFGLSNYTRILINVLDANDNAPIFVQSHYNAILQPDGSFSEPLVVRALDLDEPNTANSQVTYEIIAGNLNEQFAIDSLSGAIYLNAPHGSGAGNRPTSSWRPQPLQIPSILNQPIVPFDKRPEPKQVGKILPSANDANSISGPASNSRPSYHEIEMESSAARSNVGGLARRLEPRDGSSQVGGHSNDQSASSETSAGPDNEHDGDQLLRMESSEPTTLDTSGRRLAAPPTTAPISGSGGAGPQFDPLRLPALTTLIVRAHDFGIPLRSSTCKVNIYNQALSSRSISVILNGTAEQLESRREAIERAFGALTGSRAIINSIDALSDSSSLSVAQMKLLASLQHSQLVDLTDLSSLMSALDYEPRSATGHPPISISPGHHPLHQDRLYHQPVGLNLSSSAPSTGPPPTTTFYTDINSIALDSANALERKLLIYIIIVGVCILALLVIWMIYSCLREDQHHQNQQQQIKLTDGSSPGKTGQTSGAGRGSIKQVSTGTQAQTQAKSCQQQQPNSSAIGNNLAKSQRDQQHQHSNYLTTGLATSGYNFDNLSVGGTTTISKLDHCSMYNGQVWFEPANRQHYQPKGPLISLNERRASSAPSAATGLGGLHLSLDSALHSAIGATGRRDQQRGPPTGVEPATGNYRRAGPGNQFFPNTIGYLDNLASIDGDHALKHHSHKHRRRANRKVAPLATGAGPTGASGHTNEAFEHDIESGGVAGHQQVLPLALDQGHRPRRIHEHLRPTGGRRNQVASTATTTSLTRSTYSASSSSPTGSTMSLSGPAGGDRPALYLDSDQELLGFDSTGTPIIATHTARTGGGHSERVGVRPAGSSSDQRRLDEQKQEPEPPKLGANSEGPAEGGTSQVVPESEPGVAEGPKTDSKAPGASLDLAAGASSAPTDQPAGASAGAEAADGRATQRKDIDRGSGAGRAATGDLMGELSERLAQRGSARAALGRQGAADEAPADAERAPEQVQRPASSASERTCSTAGSAGSGARPSHCSWPGAGQLKNGELLERQSIFALTYSGLTTDKPPA